MRLDDKEAILRNVFAFTILWNLMMSILIERLLFSMGVLIATIFQFLIFMIIFAPRILGKRIIK